MKVLNKKILKNKKGFSFIEIIISLSVLAILITYGYSSLSEYYRYSNVLSTGIRYSSIFEEINQVVFDRFQGLYSSRGGQKLPRAGGDNTEDLCSIEKIEDTFGNEEDGFSGLIGEIKNSIDVVSSWLSEGIDETTSRGIGQNNFNYVPKEKLNNLYWKDYNKCIERKYAVSVTKSENNFSMEFCVAIEPAAPESIATSKDWISMQPIFVSYTVQFKNPIDRSNISCMNLKNVDTYLAKVDYTVHWVDYNSSSDTYKNMSGSLFWTF